MREAKQAEKIANEMDFSLVNVITKRAKLRENNFHKMIETLEAKYCSNQSKKRVVLVKSILRFVTLIVFLRFY